MPTDDDAATARLAAEHRHRAPERRRAWLRRVRGCADLTHAQRNVVCALGDYADYIHGTNARPGEANLADECGLSTRAVRGALAAAQKAGLIERTSPANPRTGRAAVYRLVGAPTPEAADTAEEDLITGTTVPVMDADTGTAVPVVDANTGTAVPVNNSNTGTVTSSIPEQPFLPPSKHHKNTGVLRTSGTSPEPWPATHTERPPSRFCDRHPMGYRGKCGDCANARTAFNAWQAAAAEADVAAAAVDDLERLRRRKQIDRCPDCDEFGRRDDGSGECLIPCDHPRLDDDGQAHAHG